MVPPMMPLDAPSPLRPLQQSALYHAALTQIGVAAVIAPFAGGRAVVMARHWPGLGRVALLSRPMIRAPSIGPGAGLGPSLGAQVVIVNADTPGDGAALWRAGFIRLAAPKQIAALSLAGGAADWLARMHGKWRNRLRHAQRHVALGTLTITQNTLPPDPRHWLFYKDADQQGLRGYRNLPPGLITAMAAQDSNALCLYTAREHRRAVAAMLFARDGCTASYLIGWTDDTGRRLSAHNLILWQAMTDFSAQGVVWVDLGLCDSRAAPGLARFKLGCGAALRPLGGTWVMARYAAPLHRLLHRLRAIPPPRATIAHGPAAPPEFPAR